MSQADLIEIIETQKQRINSQQTELAWFTNSALPIAARFAGYAVQKFIQQREPNEEGWYKGYLPKMEEIAGVDTSTISRGIATLAAVTDALDKYTYEQRDEDGHKEKSLLYFRPTDLLDRPDEIIPTKEIARHGGNHPKLPCPDCGCVHRRVKRREECAACGHKFFENEHTYQACEPLQDATLPIDIPIASCNASFPDTPPIVEPILDPQELERQAAQLLVAIAGEHTQHIEMIPTPQKYTTVKSSLTQDDLLKHLQGMTTKGVFNRSLDGMTRAIWFDPDNPEEWQICRDAAQELAVADDFKPILAPSPTNGEHAGGGHLWIIFDAEVDAYSALQTLYQYVPRLKAIKDFWPGGGKNARLPGGKYVAPHFEAWCHLFDEHMQNGIGTAAMLIERQTPASVVIDYPKPEPTPEPQRAQPAARQGGYLDKDLAKQVTADFNASHSWVDLLGQPNSSGKYGASWRNDHNPNVHVYADTDLAYDHSTNRLFDRPFDKYDCWCMLQGGQNWEAFRKQDLAQRCAQLREVQEPIEPEREAIPFCPHCHTIIGVGWDGNVKQYKHYTCGKWLGNGQQQGQVAS